MTSLHPGRQIAIAAAAVLTISALCFPFSAHIGHRSVALILLFTVSVLAMRLELAAVITAAVLSALLWDFFFIPPIFTLHIESAEDVLFMMMYFIVAVLNGIINRRLRQLEELRQEKTERESALGLYNALFSSLSHDLRTPIAAVLGAADTLRESATQLTPIQHEKLLDTVLEGSINLSTQIENLLSMTRLEAGMIQPKKSWCDVQDLLQGVLRKTTLDASQHQISIQLPDDFPLVQLDVGLTHQILQNLFANALNHTPTGSHIQLSAHLHHHYRAHFEVNDHIEDMKTISDGTQHQLIIEIRDNGPGFTPEALRCAFDKFYRPENSTAVGTGLGLYVARGFTEAQGGEVNVRNLPEGGACFTLEFLTPILSQTIHHE